ncbi:hypothetical protein RHGRI_030703 [Rhododendron griersonianum]|uniref:Uncharacterized protein n=1 Tax=Rhododendron griersonianum TaxID=479676 RepID=A0AAV6I891_9ERIC|nr:hypothetical protein RHGRI_030703 [Rhododendron griersonianum]
MILIFSGIWDLAGHDLHDLEFRSIGCLDDDFDSNGDLASRAPEASKSSPMCCEAPLHSQSPYNMNEPLSMNENSHIEMATSESSVKDLLSPVEWTADIEANDNSSSHPLPVVGSTPPKGVDGVQYCSMSELGPFSPSMVLAMVDRELVMFYSSHVSVTNCKVIGKLHVGLSLEAAAGRDTKQTLTYSVPSPSLSKARSETDGIA